MTTAIQKLIEAARKVRDARGVEYGCTSATIDVTVTSTGTSVEYRIWQDAIPFKSIDLDDAVEQAIRYDAKADKLRQAAELRRQADELEKEAA